MPVLPCPPSGPELKMTPDEHPARHTAIAAAAIADARLLRWSIRCLPPLVPLGTFRIIAWESIGAAQRVAPVIDVECDGRIGVVAGLGAERVPFVWLDRERR